MSDESFREWQVVARGAFEAEGAARKAPRPTSKQWADYIHSEVRATCTRLGWGYQVRRKWSARETPLIGSDVEDYEWKLIPGANGKLRDLAATEWDYGTYYVVSLDRNRGCFVLQHSTLHEGAWGPTHYIKTFTEIQGIPLPVVGYLGWFLLELTSRYPPNGFSIT